MEQVTQVQVILCETLELQDVDAMMQEVGLGTRQDGVSAAPEAWFEHTIYYHKCRAPITLFHGSYKANLVAFCCKLLNAQSNAISNSKTLITIASEEDHDWMERILDATTDGEM